MPTEILWPPVGRNPAALQHPGQGDAYLCLSWTNLTLAPFDISSYYSGKGGKMHAPTPFHCLYSDPLPTSGVSLLFWTLSCFFMGVSPCDDLYYQAHIVGSQGRWLHLGLPKPPELWPWHQGSAPLFKADSSWQLSRNHSSPAVQAAQNPKFLCLQHMLQLGVVIAELQLNEPQPSHSSTELSRG